MTVLDTITHQGCFLYESGMLPTAELRNLEKGYQEETVFRKNKLVFMRVGKVQFIFRGYPETTLRAGEDFLILLGGTVRYAVLKSTKVSYTRIKPHT